jgi:hypothetical protein
MRTTLDIEDDALQASELIRRGCRYQLGIGRVNGLPGFDVPDDFPAITTQQVLELLDQE